MALKESTVGQTLKSGLILPVLVISQQSANQDQVRYLQINRWKGRFISVLLLLYFCQ